MDKYKLLFLLGPTATGKTDLALKLAKKYNGELVAADSRQVYIGLDIGTGKMPSKKVKFKRQNHGWEINGIRIWMYDVVDLKTQYTVFDYGKDTRKVIKDILKRGKLPIIVGGTGLYLKVLTEDWSNLNIPINKKLRKELEKLSIEDLQKKLRSLSPGRWKKLNESDKQNPRRLLRSIEIESMYGYTQKSQKSILKSQNYNILKIGLKAPRQVLYKKSDFRVLSWFSNGIIDEVKKLVKRGIALARIKSLGLEYSLIADYLENRITEKDLREKIKFKIHGYIRRQITWFKKEEGIYWFDITDINYQTEIEKLISSWYHLGDDKTN